jgi:hypothetical protein
VLKLIFWTLLCVNGGLLAYQSGYLGKFKLDEREPARMRKQLGAEKLRLIDAAQAAAATAPKPVPAPVVEAPPAEEVPALALAAGPAPATGTVTACTEIGDFGLADARLFDSKIAPLELKESRRSVSTQEITNHIVFIPSPGGKDEAEAKTAQLKAMGVDSYFIMPDGALKGAISLGVFKSETAAKALLASLTKQGVRGARILARGPNKVAYQFRRLDAARAAQLARVTAEFPDQKKRACST